jgi:adenylate cyclase
MASLLKHWPRIVITLLPLIFALLHVYGVLTVDVLQRIDDIIYDARLRWTMPQTLDQHVVIVDLDEKSLAEVGHWPWSRNKLADLTNELFERQKIALLGFDVVFAEADESSGLKQLSKLANKEFRDQAGFSTKVEQLRSVLDYDGAFAQALKNRPVALGYYLTSDRDGHASGTLPTPVIDKSALKGRQFFSKSWDGYGASIDLLARAAPLAGFFNSLPDSDGVVRSVPLVTQYKGQFYEPLSLLMFRMLAGMPTVSPGFPPDQDESYEFLESIKLKQGDQIRVIPVNKNASFLVPYRGYGGPRGGSFQYVSASDVLAKRLAANTLKDKIVIVGTTASGLIDLRATPVGAVYPGVEIHANIISALLESRFLAKPDYAVEVEAGLLLLVGLLLALVLPLVSALTAVLLSVAVLTSLIGLNFWLYLAYGLVLPLASTLTLAGAAFALNMSYGFLVESRSKRELAHLFGTYVPPELVDEMVKDPDKYSMQAKNQELTVMFSDIRGFTSMSERMEPIALQQMLNEMFSQLTSVIRHNRGTIDKYMGDCVMAFWGAPVETPDHAQLAVKAALEMSLALRRMNQSYRERGLPEIGIGIGLNTGSVCVGDMGSDIRRAYTVIGDAVNLASRLEGLSKVYGVDTVISESTREMAPGFVWQELDSVRVKGKAQAVAIFYPVALLGEATPEQELELSTWRDLLQAYRSQNWDQCDLLLHDLLKLNKKKYLYQLYSERVAARRLLPLDPAWDGTTNFQSK